MAQQSATPLVRWRDPYTQELMPVREGLTMDDFEAECPLKRDPSRRWIKRSVVIAAWTAFALTCFTVCFAVTMVMVAVFQGLAEFTNVFGIIEAVIVVVTDFIPLMVQWLLEFVMWLLEWFRILGLR